MAVIGNGPDTTEWDNVDASKLVSSELGEPLQNWHSIFANHSPL